MTKKIIFGALTGVTLFSCTSVFAANPLASMFSNGPKGFIGGSVNSSSIGIKNNRQVNALGLGITGGFDYEMGKNNLIVDLSFDMPTANFKESTLADYTFKSDYGISLGVKYAFNVFNTAKAYAGASLHQRKYKQTVNDSVSNSRTMMHIAAVIGMEAKVDEKVGFFGELHYMVAGGKTMTDIEGDSKLNKGSLVKIGARYYF